MREFGLLEILGIAIIVVLLSLPIGLHYEVKAKQTFIKKTFGIEMTYGEVLWTQPEIVMGRHGVELK
jgi:hypothetical protein